jgi:uncharacterized protein (TIGR02466 family)
MIIDIKFPTTVAVFENILTDVENNILIDYIEKLNNTVKKGGQNWLTTVYNTHGTYNIHTDENFKNLSNIVTDYTNNFAKILQSDYKYQISSSWFNVYNKKDFQEFHNHPGAVFSAVYILKNPLNGGEFVIMNPSEPCDMYPIKNLIKKTSLNESYFEYNLKAKTLIIFRSFLKHMVKICNSDEKRITTAFNLK